MAMRIILTAVVATILILAALALLGYAVVEKAWNDLFD